MSSPTLPWKELDVDPDDQEVYNVKSYPTLEGVRC